MIAKNTKTPTAAVTAPSSGRTNSFLSAAIPAFASLPVAGGEKHTFSPPDCEGLANPFLAKLDHLFRILRRHKTGASRNRIGRDQQAVFDIVIQENDRQVSLQKLLLVDGEVHLLFVQSLQDSG